jgi:multiple sugar transport system permease protein
MATEQESRDGVRTGGSPLDVVVRWMENLSETQFAYLLLTPALLLLGVIAMWPLLSTFEMSLHQDALTGGVGPLYSLEELFVNYYDVITGKRNALMPSPFLPTELTVDALFASALTVTLIFTFASVFFETIIGFGQALVLNQDFRGRRWVRVAIIIPWAVPIVIQGMIFYLMFQPGVGLFIGTEGNPALLQQLGLLGNTPLADSQDATMIIIVADIWKTTAFMALLILAGLQSVDRNLYDVARVAGASKWQAFKKITLPIVLPTVLVAMLFRTIQAMRVYGIIETMAGCEVVPSLSCLVITSFNNTLNATAATVAFITAGIIAIVVSIYIFKYAREEMG